MQHARMMCDLRQLEDENSVGGVRVHILPERPRESAYTVKDARIDWVDVVHGGNGCWVMTKEEGYERRNTCTARFGRVSVPTSRLLSND